MKYHPFSKHFLPTAIATSLLIPTTAVWANDDVLSEQIVPDQSFISGEISEQMPVPLAGKSTTAGSIEISVFNPATSLSPASAFTTPLAITIKDSNDTEITSAGAQTDTTGKYKTPDTASIPVGTYYVTVGTAAPGSTAVTSKVSVTRATTTDATTSRPTPATLSVVYPTSGNVFYAVNGKPTVKHGAIAGTIYDQGGNPVSGASVVISNGITRWETVTDATGKFRIYLPGGRYNLIAVDNGDTSNNYQNIILKNIPVTVGQTTLPFADIKSQKLWGTDDKTLGLTVTTSDSILTATTKTIKGTAQAGTTIKVYLVQEDGATSPLASPKLLATGKTTGKAGTTGSFTLSLPAIQAGNKLKVTAMDEAENVYTSPEFEVPKISGTNIKLTADTTDNTVEQPIDVTLANDVASKISKITATSTNGDSLTLTKDGDYTLSSNAIRFKAGVLGTKPGSATIHVEATSYATADVIQVLKPGSINTTKSSAVISPNQLTPGQRNTVTITAKDQYENPLAEQQLYMNLRITNNNSFKAERYIINNVAYTTSRTRVPFGGLTAPNGTATIFIDMPPTIDGNDGIALDITTASGALLQQLNYIQGQSAAIDPQKVTIINNPTTQDTITVSGLTNGDTIKVYAKPTDTTPIPGATAIADSTGEAVVTLALNPAGGTVYLGNNTTGKAESTRLSVDYQEEPVTP